MTLRNNSENFGLLAWLNETRVRLPLRGIDIRFDVNDTVADVNLDQVFSNDRDESLDVTYTFPLPAAAAIYRCEMIVDGRVITAVVEEESLARRQFIEAKVAGHQAALIEQHRDNVFSLQLGNVPGRSIVILRISYFQELERLVDSVSLRIPTCPGVRYVPGTPLLRSNRGPGTIDDTDEVPDASLLSPPRVDALHPDAARISVRGRLVARDVDASSIVSPSHPLVARLREDRIDLSLALETALPDQDVLVRWTPQVLAADTIVTTATSYKNYHAALCRLKGPSLSVPVHTPREVWFLIDRSGSMEGRNWEQSCRALLEALACLRPDDRVGISFFESTVQHFSEKLETVADLRRDPALQTIASLGTTGGTEMRPALQAVLTRWQKASAGTVERHLVLITDGQVGNDDAIVELVRAFPPGLRVHPLGIDGAVNDAVLLKLAQHTGGRCVFIHPNDSIIEAVLAIVNAIESPTVRNLAVQLPWFVVGTSPATLSQHGETSAVLGSTDPEPAVHWTGTLTSSVAWQPRTLHYRALTPGIVLLRVRREIDLLQAAGNRPAAVALAKRFNLLCEGACFIAIDRTSHSPVATRHVYQPSMDEAVFGSVVEQTATPYAAAPFATKKRLGASAAGGPPAPAPTASFVAESSGRSTKATFVSKTKKLLSLIPHKSRPAAAAAGADDGSTLLDWLLLRLRDATHAGVRHFLNVFIALVRSQVALADLPITHATAQNICSPTVTALNDIEQRGTVQPATLDALVAALQIEMTARDDVSSLNELVRAASADVGSAVLASERRATGERPEA